MHKKHLPKRQAHHNDKKRFGGFQEKSGFAFKAALMTTLGSMLGFIKNPFKKIARVKEWRPQFTSKELETGRSIEKRGDRTRYFRALRQKYFQQTDEFNRVIDEKYYGKNYLYM